MEEEDFTTTIDLNVDAFIPDSYIPNEYQKLDIYKRIAAIEIGRRTGRYGGRADRPFWRYSPEKLGTLLEVAALKALSA